MNPAKARKAAAEARNLLQAAQWTAREIQAVIPGSTVDALLEQLHAARLAMEQVHTELERSKKDLPPAEVHPGPAAN
jgi:hypothetical protein